MKDRNAGHARRRFETPDRRPLLDRSRIAARGHDDGQRGLVGEFRRAVRQGALGAAEQKFEQIVVEPSEDRLGFRVAEADVELDQLGAVRRRSSGRRTARRETARRAWPCRRPSASTISRITRSLKRRRQQRRRRIGAHAAGVRPGVAVADALVVLRAGEGRRARSVAEREERNLLARRDSPRPRLPRRRRRRRRRTSIAIALSASPSVIATTTPFPAGEAVGLDDDRRALGANIGERRRRVARSDDSRRSECRTRGKSPW